MVKKNIAKGFKDMTRIPNKSFTQWIDEQMYGPIQSIKQWLMRQGEKMTTEINHILHGHQNAYKSADEIKMTVSKYMNNVPENLKKEYIGYFLNNVHIDCHNSSCNELKKRYLKPTSYITVHNSSSTSSTSSYSSYSPIKRRSRSRSRLRYYSPIKRRRTTRTRTSRYYSPIKRRTTRTIRKKDEDEIIRKIKRETTRKFNKKIETLRKEAKKRETRLKSKSKRRFRI